MGEQGPGGRSLTTAHPADHLLDPTAPGDSGGLEPDGVLAPGLTNRGMSPHPVAQGGPQSQGSGGSMVRQGNQERRTPPWLGPGIWFLGGATRDRSRVPPCERPRGTSLR